jgi:hypothetical protein
MSRSDNRMGCCSGCLLMVLWVTVGYWVLRSVIGACINAVFP